MKNNLKQVFTRSAFAIGALVLCSQSFAQVDTTKKGGQAITITSAYQPELIVPAKISFYGAQLPADTNKYLRPYLVPAQNLYYTYQPIPLRPLALQADTNLYLGGRNYVKVGFGSLTTPYLNAGISVGDGKTGLATITADYIGSKGKDIKFQDYSQLNVKLAGSYFLAKNELYGSLGFHKNDWYQYGYNQTLYNFNKSDLKQGLQDIAFAVGIKNTTALDYGLSYNPSLQVNLFSNTDKATETSLRLFVPVSAQFGNGFGARVELDADVNNYKTKGLGAGNVAFNNNLISAAPSLTYTSDYINFSGGVRPTWNNGEFKLLPNIVGEARIADQGFSILGGWVGRYLKNSYRNLTAINPFLDPITFQKNTKEVEYYGGIRASLAKRFSLFAKAGLVKYTDLPIFINDTAAAAGNDKAFIVSNEKSINNFRIQGDLSYIDAGKFTLTGGFTLNAFTGTKQNDKAWHTIPLQIRSSVRFFPIKNLTVKGDLNVFSGSKYVVKGNQNFTTKGGTDLSAGFEYKINKQFSVWADANNLLNSKYERWNNYQVYGINFLGGILVRF